MNLAITRALAHFVWEGALIGVAAAALLRARRSARARYFVAVLALLAMVLSFAVTLMLSAPPRSRFVPVSNALILPVSPRGAGTPAPDIAADRLSIPALVWMSGVLILYLRSFASWMLAERLRRVGVCAPPAIWQQRLDALRRRLALSKPVKLLESCIAETPAVVGFFRPVVLIPLGLFAGLPPEQVEAILLHELAHIRRYDYAVNLLVGAVEGLLFYHPAVWWLARVVRAEREHCCDDEVVAATGDRHGYASALASLERYRWTQSQAAAMAARGGNLMHRIRRILNVPEHPRSAGLPIFSAIMLLAAGALLAAAWQAPKRSDTPSPQAAQSPYDKWLNEDVLYIITDEERAAFQALPTNEEREHFIEQFWQRRDPTPGTVANEYKQEHYRRIAYANQKFGAPGLAGWKTDRGRIYIIYGPPDEIESHPSGTDTRAPFEQWLYRHIEGIGDQVMIDFDLSTGEYRPSAAVSQSGADRHTMVAIPVPAGTYIIGGRLMTSASSPVQEFRESVKGPRVYTRSFTLPPGSYTLHIAFTDPSAGRAIIPKDLSFTVR